MTWKLTVIVTALMVRLMLFPNGNINLHFLIKVRFLESDKDKTFYLYEHDPEPDGTVLPVN